MRKSWIFGDIITFLEQSSFVSTIYPFNSLHFVSKLKSFFHSSFVLFRSKLCGKKRSEIPSASAEVDLSR